MVVWNEERLLGGRFGDKKGHASQFQPPSSSCWPKSCLASASLGSLKYAQCQNSAIDAGLGLAAKVRPVVEWLKHVPLVTTVDHFASLLAGGVEIEVLPDDETVKRNEVPLRPWPLLPAGGCWASSWLPSLRVATRDRSAAIALGALPVRSLMTCQRMAGSESRSHLR